MSTNKPAPKARYWMGTDPQNCDICRKPFDKEFIDGATLRGPWANMCPTCWNHGLGLGGACTEGRGQKYAKQEDGRWLKVEG